jgi:hypothetical protein
MSMVRKYTLKCRHSETYGLTQLIGRYSCNCIRIKTCALNSTCICTLLARHWPEIYSPANLPGASDSAVKIKC